MQRPPKTASFISHLLANAKIDAKSVKMAIYGFFVSAPLGHVLVGALQKRFAGKTGTAAKIGQILASNLLVAPIQATGNYLLFREIYAQNMHSMSNFAVYLSSMAIINGAKSIDDIIRTVKGGFMSVMRVGYLWTFCNLKFALIIISTKMTWITSPLSMVIAQKFIAQEVSLKQRA